MNSTDFEGFVLPFAKVFDKVITVGSARTINLARIFNYVEESILRSIRKIISKTELNIPGFRVTKK